MERIQRLRKKADELERKRQHLACAIGTEHLKNTIGEIEAAIYKNNLQLTPTVLKDLFDFIWMINQINI